MQAHALPSLFLPSPIWIIQEAELQSLIKTRAAGAKWPMAWHHPHYYKIQPAFQALLASSGKFPPSLAPAPGLPSTSSLSPPGQSSGGFSSTSCADSHPNTMQHFQCQNISWCWIWVFPCLLNLHGLVLLSKMTMFLLFSQLFASEAAAEELQLKSPEDVSLLEISFEDVFGSKERFRP